LVTVGRSTIAVPHVTLCGQAIGDLTQDFGEVSAVSWEEPTTKILHYLLHAAGYLKVPLQHGAALLCREVTASEVHEGCAVIRHRGSGLSRLVGWLGGRSWFRYGRFGLRENGGGRRAGCCRIEGATWSGVRLGVVTGW
jgi:hypothetical protein